MQLTVAICEDNSIVCEDIRRRISDFRPDYLIDTYQRGEEVLLSEGKYDIIFLDIELPGKNGMCIAKNLREKKYVGHIIFLTSHTEFMPDAFKVKAFRFLEKPIGQQELQEAIMESEREIVTDKKRIVTNCGREVLVCISDILYIEAQKNKTILYTRDEILETNDSLKYWEQELGTADFFRVHKSYLVALRHIKILDFDSITLHGTEVIIPVSRRNAALVKKVFFAYVKRNARFI